MINARVSVCHFQSQFWIGSDFTPTPPSQVFLHIPHLPSQQVCMQWKLLLYTTQYRGQHRSVSPT